METATTSAESARTREIARCQHCDTPTANGAAFCCSGCEAAYEALKGGVGALEKNFSAFAVQEEDGRYSLTLFVKGIHCASCIQLIENALYEQEDVISARVNMSTQRLTFSWRGKQERGDALATIIAKLGYPVKPFDGSDAHESSMSEANFLLRCIAVSGFAMGNLMMISIGLWSSSAQTMGMVTQDFFHWVSALIALPVILYAGRPFFYSAWAVLKERHTNMDVPISLAVVLASGMSLLETIRHGEHIYFDSAVMLLFFLLIGRYLDARAKGKARESAGELLSMLHGTAVILEDGKPSTIPIRDVREGMVVLVAAGENIPADAIITHGQSECDMSLITGETQPQLIASTDC